MKIYIAQLLSGIILGIASHFSTAITDFAGYTNYIASPNPGSNIPMAGSASSMVQFDKETYDFHRKLQYGSWFEKQNNEHIKSGLHRNA